MKVFICTVCKHLEFGEAPQNCPVCWAPKEKFKQNDNVFQESREKSPEAEIKHIPVVKVNKTCSLVPENNCTEVIVRVGEVLHPMEEKHQIGFIDCYVAEKFVARAQLTPQANPAVSFHLKEASGKITVVENCNIHGYWFTEAEA